MGDSAGAPGLFCVDADTSPCGMKETAIGSGACVLVRALLGRVGRAGLPGAFWCASPFLWPFCPSSLLGPLPGWGCPWLGCLVFFPFFSASPLAPWLSPALCAFRPWVPWALALFVCSATSPRPFFFPSSAPPCPGLSVVSGPGCPRPLRFVADPPPLLSPCFSLFFFSLPGRAGPGMQIGCVPNSK